MHDLIMLAAFTDLVLLAILLALVCLRVLVSGSAAGAWTLIRREPKPGAPRPNRVGEVIE